MNSFKDIAYQILKEVGKPLHSKEITKIALERGFETKGKTPQKTMDAELVIDINSKGDEEFIHVVGKGKLYRITIKKRGGKVYLGRQENDVSYYLNHWDIVK